MATDWSLIRDMMNTAIDSCERFEKAGYAEKHRDLHVDVDGHSVSIYEFMISAWTYPENIRYQIIRERHDCDDDAAYVPEAARIVTAMAAACSELIGAKSSPGKPEIQQMLRWYREHAVPAIEPVITAHP